MTDWSKSKVTDLRAELKNRGLPQTGVKAVLVERLVAAENGNGSESDATLQGDASKINSDSATSPDDVSPIFPTGSDSLPASTAQTTVEPEEPSYSQPITEDPEPQGPEQRGIEASSNEAQPIHTSQPESTLETPNETQPTHTIESSQTPAPSEFHHSALPSVEPREVNEDRQKRKRRSQSPPPSATDAAYKRLRVNDAQNTMDEVGVTSTSDTEWVEKHNGVDAAEVNAEAKEVVTASEAGTTIAGTVMEDVKVVEVPHEAKQNRAQGVKAEAMDIDIPTKEEDKSAVAYDESPSRPRDSRFKTLFSGEGAGSILISRDVNEEVEPDRIIGPAIHPATSGLYISHLMRPINPAQFQAHLSVLAAPPDSKADPDAIVKFYVDPIRTHAFASFTTVAAAARVRSALHDRIWPDEKSRKPLWVDFVPADKVTEWIDQEQKSNPGGRSVGKKWEVYYDVDEDRHVTAILQEANTNVFARPMHPNRQPSISNSRDQAVVEPRKFVAPSGPRSFQPVPPTTNRLNELFKSTTAKPVLYWQPVPQDLVDRRLDAIDHALSKDAAAGRRIDGEINRYTFEDEDVLVDRGREIFAGIRPPSRQRGQRRGGGYQGRGGYGGGDSFRPNGNRRGNGSAYRGDRRDSRDYGRR